MMRRPTVVILDRDGVINEDSPAYIRSPDDWVPVPGSLAAIANLTRAGIPVMVATNQSGIGRGYYDLDTLEAIHQRMSQQVSDAGGAIADIAFCPHQPGDNCACRKPRPGMLLELARKNRFAIGDAVFVGDSARDLEAAAAAGCDAVLVLTGNGANARASHPDANCFTSLAAYVDALLAG